MATGAKKRARHGLRRAALALLACAIVLMSWLAYQISTPVKLPHVPFEFELMKGTSLKGAARQMADIGILPDAWSFVLLGRLTGKAGQIKAGNYELKENLSPWQLLARITRGDYAQSEITFIAGWSFRQVRKALDDNPDLVHDTTSLSDQRILERIGVREPSPEGIFFPDTYFFPKGTGDIDVLKRAYTTMRAHLEQAWEERSPGLPLSDPYQALILASLVEKETGLDPDRPMIAGVLVNRLRLGMKLQTDPAVIYGLGASFDGNLRKRDLATDQAYNTYTRPGLPPTPIALPSMASIQAALHPAHTKALYFVARGDGTTEFSDTLAQHNLAVTKYQKK